MPVSASVASSSRSRTDPAQLPAAASHRAHSSKIASICGGVSTGTGRLAGGAQPDRQPRPRPAAQVHQARQIPARPAARPVKTVSDRDRVHIPVIAVKRQHRRHPHRDRRLRQATRRGGTRQTPSPPAGARSAATPDTA